MSRPTSRPGSDAKSWKPPDHSVAGWMLPNMHTTSLVSNVWGAATVSQGGQEAPQKQHDVHHGNEQDLMSSKIEDGELDQHQIVAAETCQASVFMRDKALSPLPHWSKHGCTSYHPSTRQLIAQEIAMLGTGIRGATSREGWRYTYRLFGGESGAVLRLSCIRLEAHSEYCTQRLWTTIGVPAVRNAKANATPSSSGLVKSNPDLSGGCFVV